MKKYNLTVIPVVDKYRKLLGIITVDDIIDVIHEEASEDIAKMVGTQLEDIETLAFTFEVGSVEDALVDFDLYRRDFRVIYSQTL
jgi:Mg/Co/Ni transporter MgtE